MATGGTKPTAGLSRRRLLGAAGAAGIGPLLAACTGGDNNDDTTSGPADRVTYMTAFGYNAREVYARVAQEKGFFAEARIEIASIEAGGGGDTNHTALAGGEVDFMTADSSGAFTRYVNGEDTSFQALAAVHQLWPMALLGFADTGLVRPRDLNGATIGLAAGSIAERIWPAYAAGTPGLDPSSVEVVPTSPQTQVSQLVAGQLDAIALFTVSAPGLEVAGQGREVTALPWSDTLPDLYGNVLITRKEMVANKPDLVTRFTGALLRGLAYTLEHPQEAGRILNDAFPEQDPQVGAEEITLMRDFCYGGLSPDQPLGFIDQARLVRAMRVLTDVGEITGDFNQALPRPDGDGSQGVVNFGFVPGATEVGS